MVLDTAACAEDLSGFLSHPFTVPTERRDYREWHHGRSRYAVWVVDAPCRAVSERYEAARARLSPYLFAPYRRALHLSVFVCGFPARTARFKDDYPAACMAGHIEDLAKAGPAPFEIEVGGINSFASAPYLAVRDRQGGLAGIRNLLSSRCHEIRFAPYTPHLTLGLYCSAFDTRRVTSDIAGFSDTKPIAWRIEGIRLATYSACEIGGPLRFEHTVRFG